MFDIDYGISPFLVFTLHFVTSDRYVILLHNIKFINHFNLDKAWKPTLTQMETTRGPPVPNIHGYNTTDHDSAIFR